MTNQLHPAANERTRVERFLQTSAVYLGLSVTEHPVPRHGTGYRIRLDPVLKPAGNRLASCLATLL
jgi:hypothetical protein